MRFLESTPELTEAIFPGCVIVIYSGTGVGKTVSSLKTLKTPIFLINMESRDPLRAIVASEMNFKLIPAAEAVAAEGDLCYNNYDGDWRSARTFMETFDFSNYASIILDGGTELSKHSSRACLAGNQEEMSEDRQEVMSIKDESTLEWSDYSKLADQMDRMIEPLTAWAQKGKHIVINVLLADEMNEWKESFEGKPMFIGGKFGKSLPGKVDLIGMATRRYTFAKDEKGENKLDSNGQPITRLIYPPLVQFDPNGTQKFQSKWSGRRINLPGNEGIPASECAMAGPLDFGAWLEHKIYNPTTKEWEYQSGYEDHKPSTTKTANKKGEKA